MKKAYVFVDESYDLVNFTFYVISVVWTEKEKLPESIKDKAMKKLSYKIRRKRKFHFSDDPIEVRRVSLKRY